MNLPVSAPPDDVAVTTDAPRCPNCREPLLGEFCYACGQPKKGFIRHLSGIIGDFLDTVFNIDSRTLRTVFPLFFRPGFLSLEYFDGRRVRYVTPLRLYFFFSVLAFLAVSWITHIDKSKSDLVITDSAASEDPEKIEQKRQEALQGLAKARAFMGEKVFDEASSEINRDFDAMLKKAQKARTRIAASPPDAIELERQKSLQALEIGRAFISDKAYKEARTEINRDFDEQLQEKAKQPSSGRAPTPAKASMSADSITSKPPKPPAPAAAAASAGDDADPGVIHFGGGESWDPLKNPVQIGWLNDSSNRWLTELAQRIVNNAKHVDEDPNRFLAQVFSLAPQTLFVMLPLFALMLKIFYVFKRRLYMEHLIVALHSHSFLCLAILLLAANYALSQSIDAASAWQGILSFIDTLIYLWIPLYLLIAQKRIYRQGWLMTLVKYGMIGMLYSMLIVFGVMVNMMLSLASL